MWCKTAALLLVFVAVQSLVFPPPRIEQHPTGFLALPNGVCGLFQTDLQQPDIDLQYYFNKITKRLNNNLLCQLSPVFDEKQHTPLTTNLNPDIKPEGYTITVNQSGIYLEYADYSGYVYALESLSQLVKDNSIAYTVILDEPLVSYRGIMIDSARHFLSIAAIKRVIESMPLSKLNVLHWHLVDDESFPVVLGSHPELSAAGRFTSKKIYTIDDIKAVIKLGELNAVQIVPEIDTPAHVRSWGLGGDWKSKNITIKCAGGTGYNGQFDVSKPEVYELAKDVVREIDGLFKSSPFIHLGGDEVSSKCWDLRPDIQTFMNSKKIKSYG
jgi:hexosaminidase